MTIATVVGLGATGLNIAQLLVEKPDLFGLSPDDRVHVVEPDVSVLAAAKKSLVRSAKLDFSFSSRFDPAQTAGGGDAELPSQSFTFLASPSLAQYTQAFETLTANSHVICLADDLRTNRKLLRLDSYAKKRELSLVLGASFSPGFSCLLVRQATADFDEVATISVSRAGTAGPACARQNHAALKQWGPEWTPNGWVERRGGSGRDLTWFPEPIGGRDCYRAGLVSPLLLQRHFGDVENIVARLAATRRDRLTSWLPMIRKPHRDGGPGALQVQVRGTANGQFKTKVLGAADNASYVSAAVAFEAGRCVSQNLLPQGVCSLVDVADPAESLRQLASLSVKYSTFEGLPKRG